MKKLNYLGTAILAAGLTCVPALAQTAPTPSQDPSQQPSPTQPAQSKPNQASPTSSDSMTQGQAFTGTIVKGSDGYMLQDDTNKTSYKLDNAKIAKKFNGKNVKVTGTLDSTSNTIHVSDVQAASTY
ncbi:MAG TPA: DUF5818 domain-containing protein [Terriglobales bacterium]|nr:DUF5818 domain-containing protein [Terriglobales bacterium]